MSDKYQLFDTVSQVERVKVVQGGIVADGMHFSMDTVLQTLWFAVELAQDNSAVCELIHAISMLHDDIGKDDSWEDVVCDLIRKYDDKIEGDDNE